MSATGSLILRRDLTRRLTIEEMDGNFLYLQSLAESGSGGSVSVAIDTNQIAFGTGTGITSSSLLIFNPNYNSLITGYENNLSVSCNSSIIGGKNNNISYQSNDSSIIGGYSNCLTYNSNYSTIIGGEYGQLCNTSGSVLLGGNLINCCSPRLYGETGGNRIYGGMNNVVSGGYYKFSGPYVYNYPNIITGGMGAMSNSSAIIGGQNNRMVISSKSVILGGFSNYTANTNNNAIMASHNVETHSENGAMILGSNNGYTSYSDYASVISSFASSALGSCYSSIISGNNSRLYYSHGSITFGSICGEMVYSCGSSIISSYKSSIYKSNLSTIIGASGSTFCHSNNSAIIGASNITRYFQNNSVIVPNLEVNNFDGYQMSSTTQSYSGVGLNDANFIGITNSSILVSFTATITATNSLVVIISSATNSFFIGDIITDGSAATASIIGIYFEPNSNNVEIVTDQYTNPFSNPIITDSTTGATGNVITYLFTDMYYWNNTYNSDSGYYPIDYKDHILSLGVSLHFGAYLGHTIGNSWTFNITPVHSSPLVINSDINITGVTVSSKIFEVCNNGSIISGINNYSTNGNPYSNNTIIGGCNNCINTYYNSTNSIIGSINSSVYGYTSTIIGGYNNSVIAYSGAIIGGSYNKVYGNTSYSAIIGGSNLCLNLPNIVLMPSIMTPNPNGASNHGKNNWKLGGVVSQSVNFDSKKYIEISICGVIYKLATVL